LLGPLRGPGARDPRVPFPRGPGLHWTARSSCSEPLSVAGTEGAGHHAAAPASQRSLSRARSPPPGISARVLYPAVGSRFEPVQLICVCCMVI
uniref:Uncharacterized protein n=1 Tax=Otus sunia TaxID=257818 RepID=A0A8C8A8L2_9STRI